ncbi:hypothetical protein E3W21_07085 [Pseudomonas sp. F01002]|nr:hypothetical protein E3W21_07085 [Pseudomonas sp. F01002]
MADGGGPPEQCRSEGMPSPGEAPNGGAKPFAYFSAFGNRHRGRPSGRAPATPPGMRVRTGRFEKLRSAESR